MVVTKGDNMKLYVLMAAIGVGMHLYAVEPLSSSSIKRETFTTAQLVQRKAAISKRAIGAQGTYNTGRAQEIGHLFIAATVKDVPAHFRPQPNCSGWVGPKQYILITNQVLRSFDKRTGQPDGVLNIDSASFFGQPCVDVRINYDRFAGRWYMSCENNDYAQNGWSGVIILAVSSESVITESTTWDIYTIPNDLINPEFTATFGSLDFQQLAVSENAVFINVSTFNDAAEDYYAGSSLIVIQKSSLLAGSPIITVFPYLCPGANCSPNVNVGCYPSCTTGFENTIAPADIFDPNPQYGYSIHASNYIWPEATSNYDQFHLYRIINPGSASPVLGPLVYIPVPTYADAAFAPHKGNLFPGTVGFLQTADFIAATHVRDHQMYVVIDTQMDQFGNGVYNGDRVGIQWFQFDLTGDPTGQGKGIELPDTVPALVQYGTIFDNSPTNPKFYITPSIMTNKCHDLVISGTVSGVDDYINVFFAGRKGTDPLNTLREPVLVTDNTSLSYNYAPNVSLAPGPNIQRWGDHGSLSPDPCNDIDIWLTNESVDFQNAWGITVAQLKPAK